jgi:hypothetical protein
VTGAALRRASALGARDEAALRLLRHPGLQWTTCRGEVLGYEDDIAGNARGNLRWHAIAMAMTNGPDAGLAPQSAHPLSGRETMPPRSRSAGTPRHA